MSTPNASQVIVSYRGIAPLLENLDVVVAPDTLTDKEAGGHPLVGRAPDDPMAALGAPPQPRLASKPPQRILSPEPDELQRLAMQHALVHAIGEIAKADKTPGVFFVPEDKAASLLLAQAARTGLETGKLNQIADNRYEVQFDDSDLKGWIGSFFRDWYKKLNKRQFVGALTAPEPMGNTVRVALLGDWGTGLYGAPVCARAIENMTPAFDIIVHLGDIYYAGNTDEVDARFLQVWPRVAGAKSRAVNANHEMYSGGEGYFDKVLPAFTQPSSTFAFQNDYFLLIGLDTGYDEHDLASNQIGWFTALLAQAENRKVVLLSHHQPFSVFERQGTKLVDKLQPFLSNRRIFAWYWGHEHMCMIYDKHPQWQMLGRLVGHSGYPYFKNKTLSQYPNAQANRDGTCWRAFAATDHAPRSVLLDGDNPYITEAPRRYGPHGWASLYLDGETLIERIHAADGVVLYEKTLA